MDVSFDMYDRPTDGGQRVEIAFRLLVYCLIGLSLMYIFVPWDRFYGSAEDAVMSWAGYGSLVGVRAGVLIGSAFTLLYFVAYVGMLFYSMWARRLLLLLVFAGPVMTLFQGLSVQSNWQASAGYSMSLLEGALIAIAYFSPLSSRFR